MYPVREIKRINKVKVSEAVFEQLKQSIVRQEYLVGSKLPSENQLAILFDVSRTSIRAAIQKLALLDLVETKNGDGTYVKGVSPTHFTNLILNETIFASSQVLEVLEFRQAIEMKSCYLAAKNVEKGIVPKWDIDLLQQILGNMKIARKRNDPKQYSIEDMKFHCHIADLSKNSLIIMAMQNLSDFILGHFIEMNNHIDLKFGFGYHIRIYEAIRNGEARLAELLIYENIKKSIAEVEKWNGTGAFR